MSDIPQSQQAQEPKQETLVRPRKKWSLALDIALDCLLYILLQYMVSCAGLSFWNGSPLQLLVMVLDTGIFVKFFYGMRSRFSKFWPGVVLAFACTGVVIALVVFVGYFPVGETPVKLPWN